MASDVDICNLAVGYLGDDATVASIDPPEGSVQAALCATFYPIARDALLEMHEWNFATRRSQPADLGSGWEQWLYGYAKPSSALKILAVLAPGDDDANGQPFKIELNDDDAEVIYTNQEEAVVRYTVRVTDTARFSPLFVDALARLLASMLAGPVLKGETGTAASRAQFQIFRMMMGQAATSDAKQQLARRPDQMAAAHTPAWMAGR